MRHKTIFRLCVHFEKEVKIQLTVSLHANVYLADKETEGGSCNRNVKRTPITWKRFEPQTIGT
jgi:hypothetical protein